MSNDDGSCWYERLRSAVRKMSNCPTARRSSSPFRLLAQPISGAVLASCPESSRLRRLGRHSSSRTRTGEKRLLGLLQGCYGLLPGDRRKVLQELGQGLPCLEVIEQRCEWDASADKYRRAAHDLRVAVNDRVGLLPLARPL